jgi:hypothetical protein
MGNSRVVALDGQHKFFRFRIPTAAYGDAHLFALAAELLGPGDVVIAISTIPASCRSCWMAVDTARAAGADVIAITSSKSPLAKQGQRLPGGRSQRGQHDLPVDDFAHPAAAAHRHHGGRHFAGLKLAVVGKARDNAATPQRLQQIAAILRAAAADISQIK